jgi:uncharacterized protein YegL
MIQNKHIINALPLVADVLGRKYGVRVHIGGDRAYTDGRDIHLPSLPLDSDDTTRNLARSFIDHESGHLRDTDFDAFAQANLTPLERHIWNTLEDFRIERHMAALFPGCRHNLTWLIRHMFLKPEPRHKKARADPAASILNWLLYTLRAWDVPELGRKRNRMEAVVEAAYPGLIRQLAAIVDTVPQRCRSTQDCIDTAREIVQTLKQYLAAPPQPDQGDGTDQDKKKSRSGKGEHGIAENSPQDASDSFGQQHETSPGRSPDINPPGEQLQALIDTTGSDLPSDVGTVLSEALSTVKPDRGDRLRVAVCTEKSKSSFSPSDLNDARRATTALRTRLQALLQSQVRTPFRTGYRGRLDTQRLHRLFTGNPRIFRTREERSGIDTAVHILLDCSGSMGGPAMELAGKSCFAVTSALHAIPGVNVAVTAFPGNPLWDEHGGRAWNTVAPVLKHGERMHGEFALASYGDTPLGEALWWAMQRMQALTERRKIILAITDGYPDSKALAQNAILTAKAIGYEVYGIGIGERTGIHDLLPTSSMTILTLQELAVAMFTILSKSLLNVHHEPKLIANQI